jgi:hypothetical protein
VCGTNNSTFSFIGPRSHTGGCEAVVVRSGSGLTNQNKPFGQAESPIWLGDAAAHGVCVPCKHCQRGAAVAFVRRRVRARLQRRRTAVRVGAASGVAYTPSARGDGRCSGGQGAPRRSGSGGSLSGRGGQGASFGSCMPAHRLERWRGAALVVGQRRVARLRLARGLVASLRQKKITLSCASPQPRW